MILYDAYNHHSILQPSSHPHTPSWNISYTGAFSLRLLNGRFSLHFHYNIFLKFSRKVDETFPWIFIKFQAEQSFLLLKRLSTSLTLSKDFRSKDERKVKYFLHRINITWLNFFHFSIGIHLIRPYVDIFSE